MMGPYADHYIDDETGIRRERVTDEWILANKARRLLLTPDCGEIAVDGDVCSITVQLTTPILADGKTKPVEEAGEVIVVVDGEPVTVKLKDGAGLLQIRSAEPGSFVIQGQTYESNIVRLEARL